MGKLFFKIPFIKKIRENQSNQSHLWSMMSNSPFIVHHLSFIIKKSNELPKYSS